MKRIFGIVLALAIMLSACTAVPQPDTEPSENPSTDVAAYRGTLTEQAIGPLDSGFVQGVNDFGFGATALLYKTDKNFALSPVSIELALCMTRSGASGETAAEMARALGLSGLTDTQITDACRSLMWRANTGGMEAANGIWMNNKFSFNRDFTETCTQDFMADAYPLIIPGAMDEINAWADEKTHGRINKILADELPAETSIVLANALYFLGDWVQPFESSDTYDDEFAAPGGAVTTSFMNSDWTVPYYKNDDFSMITLEFQSDANEGQYAMAFMLPSEGTGIGDLLPKLTGEVFSQALDGATEQEVWIQLPKFEFEYFVSLKDTLVGMGMEKAFSSSDADFSAMTTGDNNIFIDAVLHKCYIRVDELGAEAAAVTAVVAMEGAMMIEDEPAKFYADRPFLFAIYSLEDGTIAFMGAVNDPTAS